LIAKRPDYLRRRHGGIRPVILLLALIGGCTVLPDKPTGQPSTAFTDTQNTTLGKLAARANAETDPAVSSLCLLDRGEEAFVSRIALIDLAERSVDVQTFCWSGDRVGKLLAQRLLRAADRGVRVRILLDDLDAVGRDFNLALIDANPNVEVRLYNPFRARFFWRIGKPFEYLFNIDRLDHRMHNKTFVVDNQVAIIGGRNVGDEYFGVNPKYNYRDFDVLALGHAAAQVSASFDAYWDDARSYPMHDVAPRQFEGAQIATARADLDRFIQTTCATFPYHLPGSSAEATAIVTRITANAVRAATDVLFDDPAKGDSAADQPSHIREVLSRNPPTTDLLMMNPYFVPQEKLMSRLTDAGKLGVRVRVLTNSLASADVVAVHAAYSKRRADLVRNGVALYEVRPDADSRARYAAADCPHATLTLHAKVFVIDRRRLFVGSMNLDPRSHRLNTEAGILVDSPELAQQVIEKMETDLQPTNAWRLTQTDGHTTWSTHRGGTETTSSDDPDASAWRKLKCTLLKLAPIEEQL
jgi:putative cardiolipin synthase